MTRNEKVGRLQLLREDLFEKKIIMHNMVAGLIRVFEPMDSDFEYLMRFQPTELAALARDVQKRRAELDRLAKEIKALESDLGEQS